MYLKFKPVAVEMLTKEDKKESARSLTFKVTVLAGDLQDYLKPDVWPYRVSVRFFRTFKPRKDSNTGAPVLQ